MGQSVSNRRAAVLSFFATAAVNFVKFHPRSAAKLAALEDLAAESLHIPKDNEWVAGLVLFLLFTPIVYALIKSPVGVWCYEQIASIVRLVLSRFGHRPDIFPAEARNSTEFQRDVLYSLEHSRKMYCLLVSAYTI